MKYKLFYEGFEMRKILFLMFVSVYMLSVANAADVVIDDFSDPSNGNAHTSQGQSAWYESVTGVIGGNRDGSVGCESSEFDGTTTAQITGGEFTVTTNKKASPSIYLSYDQTPGWGPNLDTDPFNGTFSSSQDLTGGSDNNRFAIVFTHAAGRNVGIAYFNDFLITVEVDSVLYSCNLGDQGTDAANVWMEANYDDLSSDIPATFYVDFSQLSGTPDMSAVDAIALHICSNKYDWEYSLDSIYTTVPEPMTVMLLLGGGAVFAAKRRKNKA